MNLSSFSTDDFEPVDWINQTLKNTNDPEKLCSETVFKLQSFIQEINKSLEGSANKIIVNLTNVNDKLSILNDETKVLKKNFNEIHNELSIIQNENKNSKVVILLEKDMLKLRMQDTCISLKEADNWSSLSKEMESVMKENDIDKISFKLICMQKSLKILTNVPDYADRVNKLNDFKNCFIDLVKPKINSIITNNQKQQELEKYILVFLEINKKDTLKEIYHESLCHQMVLEWQKTKNLSSKENIVDWINSFFEQLILILTNQIKLTNLIFTNKEECSNLICLILIDLFKKINEEIAKSLIDFLILKESETDLKEIVNHLITIKSSFEKLSKNIYQLLFEINKNIFMNNQIHQLFILIYTPYKMLLKNFFLIEKKFFNIYFKKIQDENLLNEFVTKTFQISRESEKRCFLLTHSVYLPKYISLIELNFIQLLDYFNSLNVISMKDSKNDWSLFQKSLFHLQILADFIIQFECFQQQIFNSWLSLKEQINSSSSIIQNYFALYLGLDDQNNLLSTVFRSKEDLFNNVYTKLKKLSDETINSVFSIPINFIDNYLSQINKTFSLNQEKNYENEEIFKLSLTPNEYITQIGQYLLTLPQHIEHFLIQENISMKNVFQNFDQTKLLGEKCLIKMEDDNAEFFLNVLIGKIAQNYLEKINLCKIKNRKDQLQLVVDIEYFNEVINDLGLSLDKNLYEFVTNLKKN